MTTQLITDCLSWNNASIVQHFQTGKYYRVQWDSLHAPIYAGERVLAYVKPWLKDAETGWGTKGAYRRVELTDGAWVAVREHN